MKRKKLIVIIIMVVVLLLVLLVVKFVLPQFAAKPIPYSEDDYVIFKQIDFDTDTDINYYDLLGTISEELGEQQVTKEDAIMEDGSAIFGQFPVRGANLKPRVVYNVGLHIRWKIASEKTCEQFALSPFKSQENQMIEAYTVGVGGCSYQALQTNVSSDYATDIVSPYEGQGTIVMDDGKWMDAVFWIEKGQLAPTLKLFAWETENPLVYYSEKRVLYGLEDANMFMFSFDGFNGSIAVDSFRMISGDMNSYLWFNAPAFQQFENNVQGVFNANPVAQVPMGEVTPQQEDTRQDRSQQEESLQDEAEEDETQDEPTIESQVLTWPEPEAILPYLVNFEAIERCANCETTVYGVDLSPMGYIFSISFGYPPDSGNTPRSDFIKQRIQLFTEPINQVELFDYYKLISRIMSYEAGEPIPIIYNWANAESNLMGIKVNVLTIASVSTGGNNFRIATKITEDSLAKLPDEGVKTPEMAVEPSLELNEVAAETILDDVWLANFDEPLKPVDSFDGRVNLWVRLKGPAEKVEAAIYHPASKTYLTYTWIDNPPVDTEIGMTGLVSTRDTKSPDEYYLSHYEGELLIRIWADGQLVRELQVGG